MQVSVAAPQAIRAEIINLEGRKDSWTLLLALALGFIYCGVIFERPHIDLGRVSGKKE